MYATDNDRRKQTEFQNYRNYGQIFFVTFYMIFKYISSHFIQVYLKLFQFIPIYSMSSKRFPSYNHLLLRTAKESKRKLIKYIL